MEIYKLDLVLRDSSGNIISEINRDIRIKSNSFDDIERKLYDFRVKELPSFQKSLLENEQLKYKKKN